MLHFRAVKLILCIQCCFIFVFFTRKCLHIHSFVRFSSSSSSSSSCSCCLGFRGFWIIVVCVCFFYSLSLFLFLSQFSHFRFPHFLFLSLIGNFLFLLCWCCWFIKPFHEKCGSFQHCKYTYLDIYICYIWTLKIE